MEITKIYIKNGKLSFDGDILATFEQYETAQKDINPHSMLDVFNCIDPYEMVEVIHNGVPTVFEIDEDLNLINHEESWHERASHRPGDLEDGDWLVHCQNDGTLGAATSRTYHAID